MADEYEDFNIAGPKHLAVVDWGNNDHKRSVVASLVRGVYILERDRLDERNGPNAFGPTWWHFFNFKLVRTLVDDNEYNNNIFGAIFEYQPNKTSTNGFPNYIVAFKGTLIKIGSAIEDLYHDLKVGLNKLHRTTRAKIAFSAVQETLSSTNNANVWLAGHSLGASMALVVGRHMASLSEESANLESFLFNPPYVSLPVERWFKNQKVKNGLRIGKSVVKAGLEVALKRKLKSSSSECAALAKWAPNLFVHPSDVICAEYIGYFESRRRMVDLWMGGVAKLASQHSIGGLMLSPLGRKAEPAAHLIHSARLTVNKNPEPHLGRAHSLDQWWSPDLQLDTDDHLYA